MILIRKTEPKDNQAIAAVIRSVLEQMNVPKIGTAYADPQLDRMFETYDVPDAVYYVIENGGKIVGGGGIMQLQNGEKGICELQKMYFLPEARGLGLGKELISKCLADAKRFGFTACYLETMTYMETARHLYQKSGFEYLDSPMGCTGHTSCPVWMLKTI
jgi:putative acetyltransferase